jgi:hypothetical protein
MTVLSECTAIHVARPPTSLEEWIAPNFEVADGLLTNDEIRTAVKWMKCGKAPGLLNDPRDMHQHPGL